MEIFDIALEKRFTDSQEAIVTDISSSDVLLIRDAESGAVLKLPMSVLAQVLSSTLTGFLKSANNLSDVANAATARSNLGLGNVDNTSDASKPVSTAQQTAINARIASTEKGAANGVAPLGADSKVPSIYLPSFVDDVLEYANLAAFPATGEAGKMYISLATNLVYRWSGSVYVEISGSPGSTDAVPEGASNLYFTNARARSAVSSSGSITYDPATGVFGFSNAVPQLVVTNYIDNNGLYYSRSNSAYLNTAGNGWVTWFDRNGGSPILTVPTLNAQTLGTITNPVRVNNSVAIWDTATGAAAGKDLTWRMLVGGGNANSVLGRIKPSSYTSFKGVTQNVLYLYVGAWNNNDDPGTPVATFGSAGDVDFKGRVYAPHMSLTSLSTYADNAAAVAGGLAVGTLYKTSAGALMITV